MRRLIRISPIAVLAAAALSGCVESERAAAQPFAPDYKGVQTTLLDGDLVQFEVAMTGARGPGDVEDYAECAAAQYALIRGYGFARHLRTKTHEEAGVWRGDAVYTISPALPRGLKTIDAEVVVSSCVENAIPMV